ncbi:hypothetical protein P5673_010915 [Acropora cervicornis]|uniref:Uncharacterized protein n=1 Tax=Acropora cervicornis TaxID=6130 RepID=A0AAD9QQV0_ACRCE|nr:hypothetical protein P5673_010915 [Acropora cervicornis]
MGVISKVNKATDWVNSLVIEEKKEGSLRFCLDQKYLNKSIKREHYKPLTAETISSKLNGKRISNLIHPYKTRSPFSVTTATGQHYRRNRKDLLQTGEPPPTLSVPEDNDHHTTGTDTETQTIQVPAANEQPHATAFSD